MQLGQSIEERYLWGFHCIEIPQYYEDSIEQYLHDIFKIMNYGMAGKVIPFVIVYYSRSILPRSYEQNCVLSDLHYIDFLSDMEVWYRTKRYDYLETIYCNLMRNQNILYNKNDEAAFYDWILSNEATQLTHETVDITNAYKINLIALMHEASHFVGPDEFELLFIEQGVDKKIKDPATIMREGKSDFVGITFIIRSGANGVLSISQENIVNMYLRMMLANCFMDCCLCSPNYFDLGNNSQQYLDRLYSMFCYLKGMDSLFPNMDWNKILFDEIADVYVNGIKHIASYISSSLVHYADEFNSFSENKKSNLIEHIREKERALVCKRKIYVFPKSDYPIYKDD